jgi:hypothetical protein
MWLVVAHQERSISRVTGSILKANASHQDEQRSILPRQDMLDSNNALIIRISSYNLVPERGHHTTCSILAGLRKQ